MLKLLGALACVCAATLSVQAPAAVLDAGYAGGNANDGIMFDLFASSDVVIRSFDINADFGTYDYSVYYRAGGVDGAQTDPSAWSLLGSFDALTTAGLGSATTLDITDLGLGSGLYGFYITDSGAFSINYSNSLTPSGSVQAASGPLELHVGYGVTAPFASATPDRAFNGAVNFSAVPEPASWMMMIVGFGAAGAALRRRGAAALPATI
jgi:hypothetical protein